MSYHCQMATRRCTKRSQAGTRNAHACCCLAVQVHTCKTLEGRRRLILPLRGGYPWRTTCKRLLCSAAILRSRSRSTRDCYHAGRRGGAFCSNPEDRRSPPSGNASASIAYRQPLLHQCLHFKRSCARFGYYFTVIILIVAHNLWLDSSSGVVIATMAPALSLPLLIWVHITHRKGLLHHFS